MCSKGKYYTIRPNGEIRDHDNNPYDTDYGKRTFEEAMRVIEKSELYYFPEKITSRSVVWQGTRPDRDYNLQEQIGYVPNSMLRS